MNRIVFGRWSLDVDPVATACAYAAISQGSPESCDCVTCANFAASRQTAYPAVFRQTLVDLGVSFNRETEIYHNGRLSNGLHSYGGWFHFVGSIVSGSDAFVPLDANSGSFDLYPITKHFSAGVSVRTALVDRAFDSQPLLQLEFEAEIPWVIDRVEVD